MVTGPSVAYWAENETAIQPHWISVLASGLVAVLAIGVYLLLANGLTHVVFAGALMFLSEALSNAVFDSSVMAAYAVASAFLTLAVIWVLAAEVGCLREKTLGRLVGGVIAFWGAQLLVIAASWGGLDRGAAWTGYLALAVVGIVGFVLYIRLQAWPYLVLGVVALTAAATEAAVDWSDGSLGAAGALLVAGAVLLGASALGLRLRRRDQHSGGAGSSHALAG